MSGSRRRILMLLPFAPRRDAAHGGGRVTAQAVEHLARRHRLTVVHPSPPGAPGADADLCRDVEAVEAVPVPLPAALRGPWGRRLRWGTTLLRGIPIWADEVGHPAVGARAGVLARRWGAEIVQIEFAAMAGHAPALSGLGAPRILVDHDPAAASRAAGPPPAGLLARLDARAWRRHERRTAPHLEAVVVFTERDRAAVARAVSGPEVLAIPFGVEVPERPSDPRGEPGQVLFVGGFAHPPNLDAALRLVEEVVPRLRALGAGAALTIVGEDPPERLRRAAARAGEVTIAGRVPDVAPYLDRAAVVVAPLRLGAGMRVKVAEALAAGKAVVASRLAAEGLGAADGRHLVLADGDEETAAAVAGLLADAPRRAALGRRARVWAEAELGWERWLERYEVMYARLAGPAPAAADERSARRTARTP